MNDETAYALIAAKLAGELGSEEQAKLDEWRGSDPRNEECFRECESAWSQLGIEVQDGFEADRAWREIAQRLELPVEPAAPVKVYRHPWSAPSLPSRRRYFFAALAAAAVLLALLGIFTIMKSRAPEKILEMATLTGEQQRITLPDGTTAHLNAGSRLRWQEAMEGRERTVWLEGQAYFEVTADGSPFSVQTPTAKVRVLGTSFEVWARNAKTRVIVREGRVSLGDLEEKASVVLTANQKAMFERGKVQMPSPVDAGRLLVWMHGNLVFHSQKLADVVTDLEQAFGQTIELATDVDRDMRISASFRETDLATVLSELCLALNLTYAQKGNIYLISR